MHLVIGLGLVVILFLLNVPIWAAMTTSSLYLILFELGKPATLVPISILNGVDSFTLMACPLFLIAGNIMAYGGCSPYLFNIINSFVGKIRGGVAFCTVVVSIIYGAITGSTMATLAGVSSICLPNMLKAGYSRKFCAGLIASCATLGQIIPPSVYMIVYASLVSANVGELFLSGIIPGLCCGVAIGVVAYFRSPTKEDTVVAFDESTFTWGYRGNAIIKGIPALLMPLIVLGSIYSGICTPTEAGAISCIYGILVCVFIYRTMDIKTLTRSLKEAASSTSMIFMLVAASSLFAIPLTFAQIPQTVSRYVAGTGLHGTSLIIAVTLVYLIMGCFLDPMPIMYLVVPIVLPALQAGGVNLVHFNVVTIVAMQIAQITPPFGVSMYVSSKMVGAPIAEVVKEVIPYIAAMTVVLLLTIFFPQLSLMIPNVMK